MLGFVNKLFISVQLIFFLGHVLLLAELTKKIKFFIIAVCQSESVKRNFERFIFTGNNFCLAKRQFLFKELFYRVLTNSLYDTFWQRIDQNQNFRTKITLLIYKNVLKEIVLAVINQDFQVTVESGNSKRVNSKQSLISKNLW